MSDGASEVREARKNKIKHKFVVLYLLVQRSELPTRARTMERDCAIEQGEQRERAARAARRVTRTTRTRRAQLRACSESSRERTARAHRRSPIAPAEASPQE